MSDECMDNDLYHNLIDSYRQTNIMKYQIYLCIRRSKCHSTKCETEVLTVLYYFELLLSRNQTSPHFDQVEVNQLCKPLEILP